ncbi:MAG: tRNA (adenosine(37)-N6)-threonylcarbamoyltransferase complex transferase subunit TsaD [Endomicrobium sp.]|jgi:N6-L-threonylcarbamoyladenine synthase|nr:tRNA (adenosine(37)-N6)-threonylcarbamoyltransferase complex transferase subunit TsaD [Endomicrobium sp.]
MNIIAIETSCDETSVSVISNGYKVISLCTASQIKTHAEHFGVIPEIASREHVKNINFVLQQALNSAKITFTDFYEKISAVAFTVGPGLKGALLIGNAFSRSLSYIYNKPLIPINHLEGHIFSSFIGNKNKIHFPFLSLIISGGHTELIIVKNFGIYERIGSTRDDAVGEAFDKVARILKLSYPGGPIIDIKSEKGNPNIIHFTRPYLRNSWDFSFSGIKTAVLNYVKKNYIDFKDEKLISNICASFRQAIAETLHFKSFKLAKKLNIKQIVLGGGVSANYLIRKMFLESGKKNRIKVIMPNYIYCTDNAAMIGYIAYFKLKLYGKKYSKEQLKTNASLMLENW